MPKLLFYFLLSLSISAFSQNFEEIDGKVKAYPKLKNIEALGYRIQNDFKEDTDRVRAAFIWLTHHIAYGKTPFLRSRFARQITYSSEKEKQEQLGLLAQRRIGKAFAAKKGICVDYSLLLHRLCEMFRLPSRMILGVAKTEIRDLKGESVFENHTWNAVKIEGEWKLMDATWAAGHVDARSKQFVRRYVDHYFFTKPSEFIKHHFPEDERWQLLADPVDSETFYKAPIFYAEYFGKGLELSSGTSGILEPAHRNTNYIVFDTIPRNHGMYYLLNGSNLVRPMAFRKKKNTAYISKIKLRKRIRKAYDFLTIYKDDKPILNFKIADQ